MKSKDSYKSKEALRKIENPEQEQIEIWQPIVVNNEILIYYLGRIKVHDCYESQIYWLAAREASNWLIQH